MLKQSKILVAGVDTLIGRAISESLGNQGYSNLVPQPDGGLDLTDQGIVEKTFAINTPEYVFLAAGESGGIAANQNLPARLMLNNLQIDINVISAAHKHGVKRLLFMASSCVYPRTVSQPITEDALLTGSLEPTNQAYAVSKIAGLTLCQAYNQQYDADYVVAIPANAFGRGDDFSIEESHVIPGLIRRMHEAKMNGSTTVEIWGSGTPRREFIYVDDLADASVFVMNKFQGQGPINLGGGTDVSIKELALLIQETVGYTGELTFDTTRPDGMPLKGLESSTLSKLGWRPAATLETALKETYDWYLDHEPANAKS